MVSKKKLATTAVASFGVAMASMYVTQDMQADVMDLTYNGGAASATNPFFVGSGQPVAVDVDQIPNDVFTTALGGSSEVISNFLQWNDTFGGTGRTFPFLVTATTGGATLMGGPESMEVVSVGDVLDPATFVGRQTSLGSLPGVIGGGTEFDGTGSAFVAIRPREALGNLYYFKMVFAQGATTVYSGGQYGSMGETLTVMDGGGGPCTNAVGDLNGDGLISLLDVAPFVTAVQNQMFVCEGDVNEDGVLDLLDVDPFVTLIQGG